MPQPHGIEGTEKEQEVPFRPSGIELDRRSAGALSSAGRKMANSRTTDRTARHATASFKPDPARRSFPERVWDHEPSVHDVGRHKCAAPETRQATREESRHAWQRTESACDVRNHFHPVRESALRSNHRSRAHDVGRHLSRVVTLLVPRQQVTGQR